MNAPLRRRQFDADTACLRLFAFFHLNLAFSSIEEDQRCEVITFETPKSVADIEALKRDAV